MAENFEHAQVRALLDHIKDLSLELGKTHGQRDVAHADLESASNYVIENVTKTKAMLDTLQGDTDRRTTDTVKKLYNSHKARARERVYTLLSVMGLRLLMCGGNLFGDAPAPKFAEISNIDTYNQYNDKGNDENNEAMITAAVKCLADCVIATPDATFEKVGPLGLEGGADEELKFKVDESNFRKLLEALATVNVKPDTAAWLVQFRDLSIAEESVSENFTVTDDKVNDELAWKSSFGVHWNEGTYVRGKEEKNILKPGALNSLYTEMEENIEKIQPKDADAENETHKKWQDQINLLQSALATFQENLQTAHNDSENKTGRHTATVDTITQVKLKAGGSDDLLVDALRGGGSLDLTMPDEAWSAFATLVARAPGPEDALGTLESTFGSLPQVRRWVEEQ